MEQTSNSMAVARWLGRAVLVLVGAAVQLAAGAGVIGFIVWIGAGRSWMLGVAGVVLSAAVFRLGLQCARHGLGTARARGTMGRPVGVWNVVVGFAVFAFLVAATLRDTSGFGRLVGGWERQGNAVVVWTLALSFLLWPIVAVAHELGHVLAGALVGFRFQMVQVGRVHLERVPAGLRLRWHVPLPAGLGGLQSSLPKGEEVTASQLVAHAAGGAAMNAITAVLVLCVAAAAPPARTDGGAALLGLTRFAGFLSLLGVLNLVPFRTPRGYPSDGALILRILRMGAPALAGVLRVGRKYALAVRPRDWGVDAADLARWATSDPYFGSQLLLLSLGAALDRDDRGLARELLARADEVAEPLTRGEFVLQGILLDALEGHAVRARQQLQALGRYPWTANYPALAEAAVLLAEGRAREAGEALQRWDRLVAGSPPTVRVGNEWAEEAIRHRLPAAAP